MYSKDVTKRRNEAMLEHRTMLAAKEISNGYLAYPAILMIKLHKSDKQYTKYKSF